jgi:hypothetical protein
MRLRNQPREPPLASFSQSARGWGAGSSGLPLSTGPRLICRNGCTWVALKRNSSAPWRPPGALCVAGSATAIKPFRLEGVIVSFLQRQMTVTSPTLRRLPLTGSGPVRQRDSRPPRPRRAIAGAVGRAESESPPSQFPDPVSYRVCLLTRAMPDSVVADTEWRAARGDLHTQSIRASYPSDISGTAKRHPADSSTA